ncbi:Hypothetical predicted protein [Pelobates cultripes]|uniref:Uncharacterized protein n=1 Tax=Pelobates cultripes TaxID=61616 RepID=A0AAD1W213_PELCU|nr:Hypothetical predicted protein [Pelobates cultripes]
MPHGSRSGTDSNLAGLGVRWGLSQEGTAALLGLLAGGSRPPPPPWTGGVIPVCRGTNQHTNLGPINHPSREHHQGDSTQDGRRAPAMCASCQRGQDDACSKMRKTTQSKRKAPTIILPVYYRAVKLMDTASRIKSHSHGSAGSRTRLDSTHHTRRHDRVKWGGSQVHGPENLGDPLMLNALLQPIGGTGGQLDKAAPANTQQDHLQQCKDSCYS